MTINELFLLVGMLLGVLLSLVFYLMSLYFEKDSKDREERMINKLSKLMDNKDSIGGKQNARTKK